MPKSSSTDLLAAGLAGDAASAALRRAYDDPLTRAARGSLTAKAAEAASLGTLASRGADALTAATTGIGVHTGIDPTTLGARAFDDRHFRDAVKAATSTIGTMRTDALATSARALSAGMAEQIGANFGTPYRLPDHIGEAMKVGTVATQAVAASKAISHQLGLLTGRPRHYGIDNAVLGDLARMQPFVPTGYESPMRDLLDRIGGAHQPADPRRLPKPARTIVEEAAQSPAPMPVIAKGAPIRSVADIGKRVRQARKAMGMTQQHFADLAGVGRRFLIELEQGKRSLEIDRVLRVCHAAGIKLGFLA